jgi:enamine deaminase RidA (YjgF/YER057c/UK114 family)
MKDRYNYPGGAKWEDVVGYCRMVKAGNMIYVSGTVASEDNGDVVGTNDPYSQTRFIIEKVEKYLVLAGASLENVVRTRLFVTDISRWEEIGKAHGEFFKNIKPATTMVEVKALINPDYLVEIEMDAVIL